VVPLLRGERVVPFTAGIDSYIVTKSQDNGLHLCEGHSEILAAYFETSDGTKVGLSFDQVERRWEFVVEEGDK
jgi:hypothetical protein